MDNTVALAAIALATTTVGGLIWLLKYAAKQLSADLKEHTKAAVHQTEASKEMLMFMKNLNGKLKKTVIAKIQEVDNIENVEHMHYNEER